MHFPRGGYTIIEVIIVLAVSGAIFISAVTVFNGKQGRTQFTQAMQDVDSQIRSFVNDVSVSLYPEGGQYNCAIVGGKPTLTGGSANGVATNGSCIFLGKALQADTNPGAGNIYAYTVLGTRLRAGVPVTVFSDASPSPATNPSTGALLYETYSLGYGINIKSSKVGPSLTTSPASAPRADMVGIYNNLQTTSTAGRQSILSYGYTGFTTSNPFTNGVKNTIENSSPPVIQVWYLCFESSGSNQTAQLAISASSTGVTTKLEYISC